MQKKSRFTTPTVSGAKSGKKPKKIVQLITKESLEATKNASSNTRNGSDATPLALQKHDLSETTFSVAPLLKSTTFNYSPMIPFYNSVILMNPKTMEKFNIECGSWMDTETQNEYKGVLPIYPSSSVVPGAVCFTGDVSKDVSSSEKVKLTFHKNVIPVAKSLVIDPTQINIRVTPAPPLPGVVCAAWRGPRGDTWGGRVICDENSGEYFVTPNTKFEFLNKKTEEDKENDLITETFDDIIGCDVAVQTVKEFIDFSLFNPEYLAELGQCGHRGCVLCGPGGTGKTAVAHAALRYAADRARQIGVQFGSFFINGGELVEKYRGETEAKIQMNICSSSSSSLHRLCPQLRGVFSAAARSAPSLIVIDEIDAIGMDRENTDTQSGETVSTLLTLIDGVFGAAGVLVLATTSRAECLDKALRRGGRLDLEITFDIPSSSKQREKFFEKFLSGYNCDYPKNVSKFAELSVGYSPADIKGAVGAAAAAAMRRAISQKTKMEIRENDLEIALMNTPSVMRKYAIEVPKVHFDDIIGYEKEKQTLLEAISWPTKHGDAYRRLGVTPPRGVLLHGPSGCGKTKLAQAIAGETGRNYFAVKGPQLLSKWVGESERAVKNLFESASLNAPSDDVDGLVGEGRGVSSSALSERVLSQLLVELDGLRRRRDVVVVAATSRPEKLDRALLRPGRFDSIIYLGLPTNETVKRIVEKRLLEKTQIDLKPFIERLYGQSCATVCRFCDDTFLNAIKRKRENRRKNSDDSNNKNEKVSFEIANEDILSLFIEQDDLDKALAKALNVQKDGFIFSSNS